MAFAITEVERQRTRFAAGVGLAAFAISLPLVRLLVDAPEFLIAHRLTPAAGAVLFLVVIAGVPLVLGVLLEGLGRLAPRARTVAMAVLGVVAFGGLLQPLAGLTVVFTLGAVVGGTWLAVAEAHRPAVRSVLASLAVLVLLLGAWVAGPSRVGSYLRSSGNQTRISTVGTIDTPVVFLVFDEVSMIPMLTSDLKINAQRFPNVAALADTSHWFRQASSVSPQTSASVPAVLSGRAPDLSKVPVAADYPTNIFVQLGGSMAAASYEPITALCPESVCTTGAPRSRPTSSSLSSLVGDTTLVLRQAVSSDAMRASLPSIDQGWAGFGRGTTPDIDAEAAPHGGYGTFPAQVEELTSMLDRTPGRRAPLLVGHFIAPHMPWISLPDGSTYTAPDPAGMSAKGGTLTWDGTAAQRREGYQRYVLQVGALDRALGSARAALEAAGIWDDAIVVVTADHGIQFDEGGVRAVGPGGAEVTNVPLFIKEPHQHQGTVETSSALTIDALPTVLGLLDVAPKGHLDGVDLLAGTVPSRRTDAFLVGEGSTVTPDQRVRAVEAAVQRRSSWIDPDGTWDDVFEVGTAGGLVGSPVARQVIAGDGGRWSRTVGETGPRLSFSLQASVDAVSVAAVCDGTIAGVAPVTGARARGTVIVSPDHCSDPDHAELALVDRAGRLHLANTTT